jgi:hypothetical protein
MVNAHYVIIDFRAKFFIKIQIPSCYARSLASDLGNSILMVEIPSWNKESVHDKVQPYSSTSNKQILFCGFDDGELSCV